MSAELSSSLHRHYIYKDSRQIPFIQIRYLGHGGQGAVDMVERTSSPESETYARKQFSFSKRPTDAEPASILQEIDIAKGLRHKHIVRLIETYQCNNVYAIIMDPVAEGDLGLYLSNLDDTSNNEDHGRRGQLSQWIKCLANAVAYLHAQNIHHRDIKPQNILTMKGNILLTDFGISKEFEEKTVSGETNTRGTPTYRAPELDEGRRPGRRADIFSLGAVFLEMLTVYSGPGQLKKFRENREGKYCGHIDKVFEWMDILSNATRDVPWYPTMLFLCRNMLQMKWESRPYSNALTTCWKYQPFSVLPPTSCRCSAPSADPEHHGFRGIDEAFQSAIESDHRLAANLLIEKGADVNAALLFSTLNGHEVAVKLLLKCEGVNLSFKDKDGRTPLSFAAENGNEAVVRLLVKNRADVAAKDNNGWTALHWAAAKGHEAVAQLLIKNGTDVASALTIDNASPVEPSYDTAVLLQPQLISTELPSTVAVAAQGDSSNFASLEDRGFGDPEEQLNKILKYQSTGQEFQLHATYLMVLTQMLMKRTDSGLISRSAEEKVAIVKEFCEVVGTIVILAEPLPIGSLSQLLQIPEQTIGHRLSMLCSLLNIPSDSTTPIKLFHLSFRDFLVSPKNQETNLFWVDEEKAHKRLAIKCLNLLSERNYLKKDICGLQMPGKRREEIKQKTIFKCLPSEVQYACLYWIYHLKGSKYKVRDGDKIHQFLERYLLQWLEALSLIGRISESIGLINKLQSLTDVSYSVIYILAST